jgi:hypothetical protein
MAVVALATCLTLPYVWFVLPAFLPKGLAYAVGAELFAFIVEAFWYRFALAGKTAGMDTGMNVKKAMIISAVLNGVSFVIGKMIMS